MTRLLTVGLALIFRSYPSYRPLESQKKGRCCLRLYIKILQGSQKYKRRIACYLPVSLVARLLSSPYWVLVDRVKFMSPSKGKQGCLHRNMAKQVSRPREGRESGPRGYAAAWRGRQRQSKMAHLEAPRFKHRAT